MTNSDRNGSQKGQKLVIVGGVAGGASCATRARRLDEHAEILLLQVSSNAVMLLLSMEKFGRLNGLFRRVQFFTFLVRSKFEPVLLSITLVRVLNSSHHVVSSAIIYS